MVMRLETVTFDATDPLALAEFWSDALGWKVVVEDAEEVSLHPPVGADDGPLAAYPQLSFVQDDSPADGRTRVHLDLGTESVEHQEEWASRLRMLGATDCDVGQPDDAPFTVLADPEGNPFCVLDPRPEYAEPGTIASIVIAAHDAHALRDLYREATGWNLVKDDADWVMFQRPDGKGPFLDILTRPTMSSETAKNRVHLDVAPSADEDQAAVVARMEALGARRADIGQQGDESWVVLADQEDNEFCILRPRD
ncbi:MAG: glyoxalase [Acidimicrobiales bacterium]|nr:glyoxalase [Acidimicrobiales bacterium]